MGEPQDSCVMHNTLAESGTPGDVINSLIGGNPTSYGTLNFAAGKYGDRVQIDYNTNTINYFTIPSGLANANKVSIDFWWTSGYSYNNNSSLQTLFQISDTIAGSGGDRLGGYYHGGQDAFHIFARNGTSNKSWYRWTNTIQFLSGVQYHFLIVFDASQGAGNRIKLYWDGIQIAHTDTPLGNATWNLSGGGYMFFTRPGFWVDAGGVDAVYSNAKIYSNASITTEIIANMNNEFWPSVSGGRLIGSKMINPLIGSNLLIH